MAVLAGAGLLLSGCGRKSPPEAPPDVTVPDASGKPQKVKPQGLLTAPKDGFILDPILK